MARATTQVRLLSAQKFEGENNQRYFKIFYAEQPDGKTEKLSAIISMNIADEVADEVFAAADNFDFNELVSLDFEIARGGQNKGKTICLHIGKIPAANRQQPNAPALKPEAPKA